METTPILFKMMQNSTVMNLFYENIITNISARISNVNFLKNKNNIKYVVLVICLIFATSLISMLSYFLFYIMFFSSSLKCILWLFEVYNPDTTNNLATSITTNNSDHYEFNATSQDVLEYYVVLIFVMLIMCPIMYIPIPFLSLLAYIASVTICLACLTDAIYRQRCCLYIRNSFTTKESRDDNGNYVPGHEGEFHKLLQAICHSLDCINMSMYNITHNPRIMLNQLNNSESITQALCLVSSGVDSIVNEIDKTYQSKKYNQYNQQYKHNQAKKSKKQKQSNQSEQIDQNKEVIADINKISDILNGEDDIDMSLF